MTFFIPSLILSLFGIFTMLGIKEEIALNQAFYLILAVFVFFFTKRFALVFRKNKTIFSWLSFFLLVITFFLGLESRGSKRWLNFYVFNFQPSEILKVFFIFYLSSFLEKGSFYLEKIKIFLKSLLIFFTIVFLVFKQPDLGNAIIFSLIFFTLLFSSSIPKKIVFNFIFFSFFFLPLGWFFLKDYQRQRIVSFFNPHFDYQGASYHMIQSIISVGAGGFFGRGLGFGTQSKLNFLPESHTDFIFASLVEQFGFLGGFLILVLYGFLFYLILKRCLFFLKKKDEQENFLVIMGVLAYFFFQMLINIGMNMGIFPITGIVLPFLSYGGSALISSFFLLALIP